MNLSRSFAVAVTVATLLISTAASQPSGNWEPKNTTPGVELEFVKVSGAEYRLRATGLPSDKSYTLWQRRQDGKVAKLGPSVRIKESGYIVWGPEAWIDLTSRSVLTFDQFGRGEVLEMALISYDETVKAFARIVPRR